MLIAALVAVLLMNGLWWGNRALYNKYVTDDYRPPDRSLYGKNVSGINYTVKKPGYPTFQGNFAINNGGTISLIIWPGVFFSGEYEYGLMIYDNDIEHGYMFYVDEDLQYIDTEKNKYVEEYRVIILEFLETHVQELQEILQLVQEEWGI